MVLSFQAMISSRQHTYCKSFKLIHPIYSRLLRPKVVSGHLRSFKENGRKGLESRSLKKHPKATIVLICIVNSFFFMIGYWIPFFWSIRPSTVPFCLCSRINTPIDPVQIGSWLVRWSLPAPKDFEFLPNAQMIHLSNVLHRFSKDFLFHSFFCFSKR